MSVVEISFQSGEIIYEYYKRHYFSKLPCSNWTIYLLGCSQADNNSGVDNNIDEKVSDLIGQMTLDEKNRTDYPS